MLELFRRLTRVVWAYVMTAAMQASIMMPNVARRTLFLRSSEHRLLVILPLMRYVQKNRSVMYVLIMRSAPKDGNRPSAKMRGANIVCDPSMRMPHTSETTIRMVSIGTTVIYAFIVL